MINTKLMGNLYNWIIVALIVYFFGLLLAYAHALAVTETAKQSGGEETLGD